MRRFLALIITLALFSCNKDTNTYNLSGTAQGFENNTQIFVFSVSENNQPVAIDTLTIENEAFLGTYPKTEAISVNYLQIENTSGTILYFPENENLEATVYKDSLASSHVKGSNQNDAYTAFSQKLRGFNDQKRARMERYKIAKKEQDNLLVTQIQKENIALVNEETNYKKQFVIENNNSLFSAMLASEMLSRKEIKPAEASEIAANFTPKIAATKIATNLQKSIESMKKAEVGGQAPAFTAPTPTGEMLSLNDVLGTYTIIDFWASWCRPCRAENPNVVRVYNKYHDKGLNIISVSLDKNNMKDRWIKAIADDKMDWHHVSNLKFWQDPIAQQYNVRSIPATFLLDEDGEIIATNLRGPALEAKIASLLGG